jgi:hypothetical protein
VTLGGVPLARRSAHGRKEKVVFPRCPPLSGIQYGRRSPFKARIRELGWTCPALRLVVGTANRTGL